MKPYKVCVCVFECVILCCHGDVLRLCNPPFLTALYMSCIKWLNVHGLICVTTFSKISNFSSLSVEQICCDTRMETVLISLLCASETNAVFVYNGICLSLYWNSSMNQSTKPLSPFSFQPQGNSCF